MSHPLVLGEQVEFCEATYTLHHETWAKGNPTDQPVEVFPCLSMAHDYPAQKHYTIRRLPQCPQCGGYEDHDANCNRPVSDEQPSEERFEW